VKELAEWVREEVDPFREADPAWLASHHFLRDPVRPTYVDSTMMFAPADGVILYQVEVDPTDPVLDIKGRDYTVRDVLADPHFEGRALVIGIFLTFYDVHTQRIPYGGTLTWRAAPTLTTINKPMLAAERHLLNALRVPPAEYNQYLHKNERVVSRIAAADLQLYYYVVQIADYDVDCITQFNLVQNESVGQGERFGAIRYGSQVEMVVPITEHLELSTCVEVGQHVEAGQDPLVKIRRLREAA